MKANILLFIALTNLPVAARSLEPSQVWPTHGWDIAGEEAVVNADKLKQMHDFAFPADFNELNREGVRTSGLVVIKNGKLVYESYGRGYNKDKPHLSWSMSKSVINTLYGRAVQQGLVDIDRKVSEKSSWVSGDVAGVTYRNLLHMASGIRWSETYEYAPVYSSVVAMLYTLGHDNMPLFAANQGLEFEPGTHWEYSSGDTNLLSGALKDIVGEQAYSDYPWTSLFDILGITSAVWETDKAGHFVGSSYWYATPRDMAKFGYLYLQDGVWDNKRLLPEGWVNEACSMTEVFKQSYKTKLLKFNRSYGSQFWLNAEDSFIDLGPQWPDVPTDACAAQGHWNQMIVIIPSENMVVVRVADDRAGGKVETNNTILSLAIAAFSTGVAE